MRELMESRIRPQDMCAVAVGTVKSNKDLAVVSFIPDLRGIYCSQHKGTHILDPTHALMNLYSNKTLPFLDSRKGLTVAFSDPVLSAVAAQAREDRFTHKLSATQIVQKYMTETVHGYLIPKELDISPLKYPINNYDSDVIVELFICHRKRSYDTLEAGQEQATWVMENQKKRRNAHTNTYKCQFCSKYHVGHDSRNIKGTTSAKVYWATNQDKVAEFLRAKG